jgi:hypothetical protein
VKDLVLTHKAVIPTSPGIGKLSINYLPKWLLERSFTEKIPLPPTGRKAKLQVRCVMCCKRENRGEKITYWCSDSEMGLCIETCFKEVHTKQNF